jgi:hypothetical protein
MQSAIGRILSAELKRIADLEERSMEEVCAEVASLVGLAGKKQRQLYNWRAGKWPIPANVIPALCRRFKSLTLVNALRDECRDVEIDLPDSFDLTREVSRTVRGNLHAYEQFLSAFEDGTIELHELQRLRECMQAVVSDAHRFLDIAATNCERGAKVLIGPNQ